MSGAVDGGHSSTRSVSQGLDLKKALPSYDGAIFTLGFQDYLDRKREKVENSHPLLNARGQSDKIAFVSGLLARIGLTRFTN